MAKKKTKKTAKKKTNRKKTTGKRKTAKKKTCKKTTKKKSRKKKTKKKKAKKKAKRKAKRKTARKTRRKHRRKGSGRVKSPLTKKELEHFRQLLLEKRIELVGNVSSMELEALRKSRLDASGDLSSMPIHMADIGTDNYEQEFALGLMDSERKMLNEIHAALNRIDEGTYGICQGLGKPIPKARLEACPWAMYCVEYAEMLEKGMVSEDDEDRYDRRNEWEDEGDNDGLDEDMDEEDEDEEDELEEDYDFDDFEEMFGLNDED